MGQSCTFTIKRSNVDSLKDLTVKFKTGGNAVRGRDYVLDQTNFVVIKKGETTGKIKLTATVTKVSRVNVYALISIVVDKVHYNGGGANIATTIYKQLP
jgi:hypothetical protein